VLLSCLSSCSVSGLDVAGDGIGGKSATGRSRQASQPTPSGGTSSAGSAGLAVGVGSGGSTGASDSVPCLPGQRIFDDQVTNARDLGGVPLNKGRSSACRKLYRGGPLVNSAEAFCSAFNDLEIRTVVDLRTDSERTSSPDVPCVFAQSRVIWAPLPVPYSMSTEQYIADLNTYTSVVSAFDVLGDVTAYPVYFHCTYGRDRTGVLSAVILLTVGATREDVLSEYELTAKSGLYTQPASLTGVLDEIERRGGIDAYLSEAGVARSKIDVLRAELAGL